MYTIAEYDSSNVYKNTIAVILTKQVLLQILNTWRSSTSTITSADNSQWCPETQHGHTHNSTAYTGKASTWWFEKPMDWKSCMNTIDHGTIALDAGHHSNFPMHALQYIQRLHKGRQGICADQAVSEVGSRTENQNCGPHSCKWSTSLVVSSLTKGASRGRKPSPRLPAFQVMEKDLSSTTYIHSMYLHTLLSQKENPALQLRPDRKSHSAEDTQCSKRDAPFISKIHLSSSMHLAFEDIKPIEHPT